MLLDTRNKKLCGLRVEISTVFEISGHFLFKGGDNPVWPWPTCHLMLLDTTTKNIYSLGMDNSTVFKIQNIFPYCAPTLPPGTMNFNKLAFSYV
jgi:hypothetical protein